MVSGTDADGCTTVWGTASSGTDGPRRGGDGPILTGQPAEAGPDHAVGDAAVRPRADRVLRQGHVQGRALGMQLLVVQEQLTERLVRVALRRSGGWYHD